MKKILVAFVLFISSFAYSQSDSLLTFSELMFRPSASNSEFIEVFNSSDNPVDLAGFKISYYTSSADLIVAHQDSTILPPNSFAVIFEADYDFVTGIYAGSIPSETLILKLDNNAFGSSGMSNSSDRTVRLLNAAGDTLDVYSYTANNNDGISDEKIQLTKNNLSDNWINSVIINGTPGAENSVSQKQFDVGITNVSLAPPIVFEGLGLFLKTKIENFGANSADNFSVELYEDADNDSLAEANELMETKTITSLSAADTTTVEFMVTNLENRIYNFIVRVSFNLDEIQQNNIAFIKVPVAPKPNQFNDIAINEIMYAPASGQPEWIEIINNTPNDINLKNWWVGDNSSKVKITNEDLLIPMLGFLVISDNENINDFYEIDSPVIVTNLPSLNNGGDDVVLRDSLNRAIDSVSYTPGWGGLGGKSLERITHFMMSNDSTNWASAINILGATPGGQNSVIPKMFNLSISRTFIQPEIPVEGDDVSVSVTIKNNGTNSADQFSIKFYIDENNDSLAQTGELVSTENFSNLQPNDSLNAIYLLSNSEPREYNFIIEIASFIDQFPEDNSIIFSFNVNERPADFNDIVINEIMYSPLSLEPEWVELYNNSQIAWNLKDWRFADRSTSAIISEEDFILQPNQYVVLSDDESLNDIYEIPSEVIVLNLPSLNNSNDDLKIIDNLYRAVDSVNYKNTWGGSSQGRSLERKLFDGESNDSTNWASASLNVRATPGDVNSIVPKNFDLELTRAEITDEFVIVGNTINIKSIVKNVGYNDFPQFSFSITSVSAGSLLLLHSEQVNGLLAGDSVTINVQYNGFSPGENTLQIEVQSGLDQNENNNLFVLEFEAFEINENPGDIVINEIMHSPATGEPEWIEIYNKSDKTIDLQGYQIADNSDTSIAINYEINLTPEKYFVIADDSSFADIYPQVGNYIIAPFPGLNNSGDNVSIINKVNAVIDSVNYKSSWGGKNGRSLERIKPEASSADSANWATANLSKGGTPGILNSMAPKDYDVAVTNIVFNPAHPLINGYVNVYGTFENAGLKDVECAASLYLDNDLDSLTNVFVARIDTISLKSGETKTVHFNYLLQNITQETGFLVVVKYEADQNPFNNNFYKTISPGYRSESVLINEIHYTPSDGEPEWFELINNSNESINLKNWYSKDVLTTPKEVTITDSNLIIEPNEMIIISRDTSIFEYHLRVPAQVVTSNFATLNNSEDGLVIKDASGRTIDSVYFNISTGGGNGYSLERIDLNAPSSDAANWGSSIDIEKSTPGRINSLIPKDYDLGIKEIFYSPLYPVLNSTVTPVIKIMNYGLEAAQSFSVSFRIIRYGSIENLSSVSGIYLNPGDSLVLAANNSFQLTQSTTVIAEITFPSDEETNNNYLEEILVPGFKSKSIIITEFMSQPLTGKSEWVEFLNVSASTINIANWSVSDVLSSPTKGVITESETLIAPNEYFIVAGDTSAFPYETESKLFEVNFGTLGNTEDGIILYDFRNAIIDSLFYDRNWNIVKGQSVEKLSLGNIFNNSANWLPTLSVIGGTPGLLNSSSFIGEYNRGSFMFNEIMFEPSTDNSEFVELLNVSESSINIGGWKLEDEAGNTTTLSTINKLVEANSFFVLAADTTILDHYIIDSLNNITIAGKNDLGLSNSGEILLLKDIRGNIIDSVNYSSKWHNRNFGDTKNLSLERISPELDANDPMNWSSSVDPVGATPMKTNSIYTELGALKSNLDVDPNPFSPDNDGFEDFTIITYNLKKETAQIRIKIFDDKGRKVRTLVNNQPSSSTGSIIFDGLDDDGRALRIGMYIIFLEAIGNNSSVVETQKKVVVVARKL